MVGTTISLAGIAMMYASRMTPSRPIAQPSGYRALAIRVARLTLSIEMLANSQITAPAGAAVRMARHSTNNVRSIKDV